MRLVVEGVGWLGLGPPRENIIEPQLGYALRYLEMKLQRGLGCSHGFMGVFEVDHLQIVGLHFFAATLRLNQCTHCLVDQCRLRFPVFSRHFEDRTSSGDRIPEPATIVAGDHNTIRNTSVSFSNLGGLVVRGKHNRVDNCIIHDVNSTTRRIGSPTAAARRSHPATAYPTT